MLAFVKKILSTIMNAIIYGVIFVSIVGGALYAAGGTRSISLAGIDFIDFFTQGGADGSAGVQASAFHSVRMIAGSPILEIIRTTYVVQRISNMEMSL